MRVIYNGKDVTDEIPACQNTDISSQGDVTILGGGTADEVAASERTSSRILGEPLSRRMVMTSPTSNLCPLSSFGEQIKSMLGPYRNFEMACHA